MEPAVVRRSISMMENGGGLITLDDGSVWCVSAVDQTVTGMWVANDLVEVEPCASSAGRITNVRRRETIEATRREPGQGSVLP